MIPDTPENVARDVMQRRSKRDWRFMQPGCDGYTDGMPPKRTSRKTESGSE